MEHALCCGHGVVAYHDVFFLCKHITLLVEFSSHIVYLVVLNIVKYIDEMFVV